MFGAYLNVQFEIYRFHCTFHVDCSDSLLELTYISMLLMH